MLSISSIVLVGVLAGGSLLGPGVHASTLIAAAPTAVGPPAPSEDTPAPVRAVPVVVIRLTGDLAAAHLVSRLRDELAAAGESKAQLVVLMLEGHRWRADVARGLADVVKASPVPVAALLGPTSRVGGGQALVALAATTCWISARTTIECEAGDEVVVPDAARAGIAPEPTGATEIVSARGLPGALAEVLLAPRTPVYAAWEEPERVLRLHEGVVPAGDGAGAVGLVTMEPSGARAAISAETAVRLGIAKAIAADHGQVLRALSLRAASVTQRHIAEDLGARKAELFNSLAAARTLTSQASDRVSSVPRGNDPADLDKRRKAGLAAMPTLQRAAEVLARGEVLAKVYPELLVDPPPGTSAVGMTPEGAVRAWHAAFKDAQGDLAKVSERAARAAETKR